MASMAEPAVAVLLGAGASADAGIPTTIGMTNSVIERLTNREHKRLLEFIRHTLAADLAQRREGTWDRHRPELYVDVDVERLFASVELLIDRHSEPWSPFVATWHPGLESFAPAPGVQRFGLSSELSAFGSALKEVLRGSSQGRHVLETRRVQDALGRVVERAAQLARPGELGDLLTSVRREMLRSLFDVLDIADPSSVAYLAPLVDLAREQGPLTIATLNYDRSIENVAELKDATYDTGIETWLTRGEFEWREAELRLLKLHGSIDWVVKRPEFISGELPAQQIVKVLDPAEKQRYDQPAVVFGEAGKLRSEGPFLELLLAWSASLRQADSLLVVGYSFRDQHVNEIIARWFNSDPRRRIVAVDPGDLDGDRGERPFGWNLAQLVREASIAGISARFEHIQATASGALARGIAAASVLPSDIATS
jgi:hypothetical protein